MPVLIIQFKRRSAVSSHPSELRGLTRCMIVEISLVNVLTCGIFLPTDHFLRSPHRDRRQLPITFFDGNVGSIRIVNYLAHHLR